MKNSPSISIHPGHKKLPPAIGVGRILMEHGKLDELQAERVAALQKEKGLRFGEAARVLNLVTEADVQRALAQQFGYAYLDPGKAKPSRQVVAAYEHFGPEVEMLRALRGQLITRWFDTGRKALSVAAVNPCDGTSRLVANLAVVFAQLNLRTLLIDANLRHPRQHCLFGLTNPVGLSDMLAARLGMEAIANCADIPHLSLLPAGTAVPNASDLVSHGLFLELLEDFSDRFDVILVDTPPFSTSADAHAIVSQVGGVLIVLRQDRTRMADVAALQAQLADTHVIGVGSVLVNF